MSHITIRDVYKNAWKKLHGSKGSIWAIAIVIVLVVFTIAYVSNLTVMENQAAHYWLSHIIFPIILYLFIGPFYGGSFMVAIKRFRNEAVNIKTGYQYLHRYLPAAITMLIVGIISNLISIIINIPSVGHSLGRGLPYFDLLSGVFSLLIYAFFLLSVPLVMDKNYSIGSALGESLKKIKSHWLRVFAILLLAYIMLFVIYIPAITGLITHNGLLTLLGGIFFIIVMVWFLPLLFLLGGSLYHTLIDGYDH